MFTVEIKINGSMIAHIYGVNKGELPNGKTRYEYDYYDVEKRHTETAVINFQREDGIRKLIAAILSNNKAKTE